jgi:phage baseplate assembly protein W
MLTFSLSPTLAISTAGTTNVATLSFAATDTQYKTLTATINWGDGTQDVVQSTTGAVSSVLTHVYGGYGNFLWSVDVVNLAYPVPGKVTSSGSANFAAPGFVDSTTVEPALLGPILPISEAAAAVDSWNFDIGADDRCLQSSLYLLLTTSRGERLMQPEYGTNLRRLVFSLADDGLYDALRADISQAVSRWEPRAQLDQVQIKKTGQTINVDASFRSLVSGVSLPVQVIVT